jgi:CheY-like chemotaxis protein
LRVHCREEVEDGLSGLHCPADGPGGHDAAPSYRQPAGLGPHARRLYHGTTLRRAAAGCFQEIPLSIPVVMIEDSKEILATVEDLLDDIGGFIVIARLATESEATAWLELNHSNWALVVTDLVLLEGSGFNLVGRYRARNKRGEIVVLSDYAASQVKEKCLKSGANAVFSKGEAAAFAQYLEAFKRRHAAQSADHAERWG